MSRNRGSSAFASARLYNLAMAWRIVVPGNGVNRFQGPAAGRRGQLGGEPEAPACPGWDRPAR
jgi:hypothetical protein